MKYYNVIDSHETFDKILQNPELGYPNMNVIYNGEEIDYDNRKEISYFTAIYDVEDLAVPTKILSNLFDISQVYKMFVDGIEVSPTANYQFGSIGKHTVKCHFLHLTSCENMFCACKDLYEIDLNRLDTSEVITMKRMFRGVTEDNTTVLDMKIHKIDCECIDTSNVTDMSYMFQICCKVKNFRLGNFNTSKVTTMNRMFQGTNDHIMLAETTDVSGWDMSNVTDITSMFAYNIKLKKLDVSNWNTSNIKYADYAFQGYSGYEMSLEKFDTSKWNLSKLENANVMFQCCTKLETLDTSNWNCTNLINSQYMFSTCKNIKQLNVTNWKISNSCRNMFASCYALEEIIGIGDLKFGSECKDIGYMFNFCVKLKSLNLSNWDVSNVEQFGSIFQGMHLMETLDIRNWNMSNGIVLECLLNIHASNEGIPETSTNAYVHSLKTVYMNNVVPTTKNTDYQQIFDVNPSCKIYLPSAYKTQWQSIISQYKVCTTSTPTYYLQDSQIIWV